MSALLEQDALYWRLVHELVTKRGYRIIRMSEHGEVWLESESRKDGQILRLLRYDLDWGSWLIKDIEQVEHTIKQIKKQSFQKNFQAFTIYVSTYLPVDDWEHRLNPQVAETMNVVLIDSSNREEQLADLFIKLNQSKPAILEWINSEHDLSVLYRSIQSFDKKRKQQEQKLLTASKPLLTYVFVVINVVMFLILEYYGSSTNTATLVRFGAKYNPAIYEGEWWRFITPVFLHIGIFHLFMNTLALYYLGIAVERIYGAWRFLLIYFSSGVLGVIASFAFTTQVSAGASGAIFGCFGALLYFGVVHRSLFFRTMGMNVIAVVLINLAIGFAVPMVDNSAHIGGLIAGFLTSAWVHLPKHPFVKRQLAALIFLLFITSGTFIYGYYYGDRSENPIVMGQLAQQLINEGENEQAYSILIGLVEETNEALPEIYFLLAYTEIELGYLDEAVSHLELVVKGREDFPEAYYNLAIVYGKLGELDKARYAAEKAITLNPTNEDYQLLYKQLNPF